MKVQGGRSGLFLSILVLFCLAAALPASATSIIVFGDSTSGFQTYDGSGVVNDALDAYLEFTVSGADLTLTLTNPLGSVYGIQQVYLNVSEGITDLTVTGDISSFPLDTFDFGKKNGYQANGFGKYDALLSDGGQNMLAPGQSDIYHFRINGGVGTYSEADFTNQYNDNGQGPYLAAMKFKQAGGGNGTVDAAVVPAAAPVPEPSALILVGSGLSGLLGLGRRRR